MSFIAKIARCILLFSLGFLLSPYPGFTQFSKLDDVGAKITKRLQPGKPKLIAVVDFQSADRSASSQGHYFAWYISSSLQAHGKKKFKVVDHLAFDADMEKLKISPSAIVPGESLRRLVPNINADVVILGTFEKRDFTYVLKITPERVSDGTPLFSESTSINLTEFLDSLIAPFPAKHPDAVYRAGIDGVGMPTCPHCSEPSYNDLARQQRIQGTDLFAVIVSADGVVQQIHPIKLLGYGLDEEAYNTIKKWKFKPATKKDGTPVAALVPIEVTFRLY